MTYPGTFIRLTAIGTLFNVEDFNWTLSLVPRTGDTAGGNLTGDLAAVASAVSTFHAAAPGGNPARLTMLKLARIGPDGRYVDDAPVVHDYGVPGIGSGNFATSRMPPQTALAITLRSPNQRGLANSGRFYVPATAAVIDTATGLMSVENAQAISNAAAAMITTLNGLDGDWHVGIASNTRTGAFQPVARVEVGRVLDTIRSRRRNLVEAYVASTTPPEGYGLAA